MSLIVNSRKKHAAKCKCFTVYCLSYPLECDTPFSVYSMIHHSGFSWKCVIGHYVLPPKNWPIPLTQRVSHTMQQKHLKLLSYLSAIILTLYTHSLLSSYRPSRCPWGVGVKRALRYCCFSFLAKPLPSCYLLMLTWINCVVITQAHYQKDAFTCLADGAITNNHKLLCKGWLAFELKEIIYKMPLMVGLEFWDKPLFIWTFVGLFVSAKLWKGYLSIVF